ncbi:S1C family serine protease [Thiofilum flexile]|uniref:S1C family serine protease n=1 Tax=Thiofilum flexile TaxID=125627 RepID=UPI000362F535|nr:S1C family serine protease [Thiofilum flexile]
MKKLISTRTLGVWVLGWVLISMSPVWAAPKINTSEELRQLANSVVKIYTTAEVFNSFTPWNSGSESRIGSGFLIEGNRIITNAHVVANGTFIEVQRDGAPERYEAEVEFVTHEADLAILKVQDKAFFTDKKPLPIGGLPDIHQEVTVYGFPTGGDSLSVTKGIVSRIEYQTYAHSDLMFKAIQIDAAINAGNSGGPVLSDGKVVGVVMQVAGNGEENIGYIIPTSILNHFLTDLADGKYDGFPRLALITEELLNPSMRKKYNLKAGDPGILVTSVCADTDAEKFIKAGDIITRVDKYAIESNGSIMYLPDRFINFFHQIDMLQVGETLKLEVLRDDKKLDITMPLMSADHTDYNYDEQPRYWVYGGFVFTPRKIADRCLTRSEFDKLDQPKQTEYVRISRVLASSSNVGFHDASMIVDKVNGQYFNNFSEFYKMMNAIQDPFITLTSSSGYEVVIERSLALAEHNKLLKKYHMKADRSEDLKLLDKELKNTAEKQ